MVRFLFKILQRAIALPCLFFISIGLVSCSVVGQEPLKKRLTRDGYAQWHQFFPNQLSEKGNWLSYTHHYKSGIDTLFVTHTATKRIFKIPQGTRSAFMNETHFVCVQPQNQLSITDLNLGTVRVVEDVVAYAIAGDVLVTQSGDGVMKMMDKEAVVWYDFEGVVEVKVSPNGKSVAYVREQSGLFRVEVFDLMNRSTKTLIVAPSIIGNLVWQKEGQGIAFVRPQTAADRGLGYYYNFAAGKGYQFSPTDKDHLTEELGVGSYLLFSDDGERIFFMMECMSEPVPTSADLVQVWNTADKDLYPAKRTKKGCNYTSRVVVWWPNSGKSRQLTTDALPQLILSGDQQHAITSNNLAYEPQFKAVSDRDYVITHIATGKAHVFLKAFSGNVNNLFVSPEGNYVTYFKEGSWWNYDIFKRKHYRLEIPGLTNEDVARFAHEETSYGSPGWTPGDKEVLIYDAYDVWKVDADGKNAVRLTRGREMNTVLRILPQLAVKPFQNSFDGVIGAKYNLEQPLYLKAYTETDGKTGIFLLKERERERALVYKDRLIENFLISADGKRFGYVEQDFDLPPQFVLDSFEQPQAVVVARSNPQQDSYYWGKSELVPYLAMGIEMRGVFVYPANYDRNKKYPLIVHIYEKQSKELHQYVLPHLPESRGFNVTNYSLQDYFVFLPCIVPKIGQTGQAALTCVQAGMEKIKAMNIIDEERMALIGHSFGGFEANFIATQKHPFRTIVSGCGYSDLVADYLYIARDFERQEYWRYESGQMRMGTSLYEDPGRYFRNSPILLAEGVTVPILAWTGEKDRNVDAAHSFKFHMALRRLKKESVLLVYPEEKHVLFNPAKQEDLRQKMEQWFAYYLKKGPIQSWMLADYTAK